MGAEAMRIRSLFVAGCLALAACDADVAVETDSSSTSTAHAGSTGASTTSGFSTGSSSSSSSTGAGGAPQLGCEGTFIDVEINDVGGQGGPKESLTASCPGGWGSDLSAGPVAYFFSGGFAGHLIVEGCGAGAMGQPRIRVDGYETDTESPSISIGKVKQWIDSTGAVWESTEDGQVQTWKMAAKTGDTVEGTFAGTVGLQGKLKSISGTFRVCKVEDQILP
jgi:hypothetical protein